MENKNYEMLLKEINSDIEVLDSLGLSDEEYKVCVNNIETLYKLKLEEDKIRLQISQNEREKKKSKGEVFERYAKIGVDILGIMLPIIFYAHWLRTGMEFEKTGTFTSTTFKGLFNKFRPTK